MKFNVGIQRIHSLALWQRLSTIKVELELEFGPIFKKVLKIQLDSNSINTCSRLTDTNNIYQLKVFHKASTSNLLNL